MKYYRLRKEQNQKDALTLQELEVKLKDVTHVIVHQDSNWADEMDVAGWLVTTKDDFFSSLEYIETKVEFPVTRHFGSNEEDDYNSIDSFYGELKIKSLTKEQYNVLKEVFDLGTYSKSIGKFWFPEN